MADAQVFTETTTRKGYTLKSPTNWTEVSKVLNWLQRDVEAAGLGNYDDVVTVEARDDEIRFSYVVPEGE